MRVEISIPESLNEITLEQYQRFVAIDSNATKDYQARKMLEIFCGVSDTLKVRKKDVDLVYSKISAAFGKRYELVTQFSIDGKDFGFIPNLENISFGEYIDLDNLLSWENMHKAMAVLYRPITERAKDFYKIEEYESSSKYSESMKKAPASVAVGAGVFFWTLSNDLSSAILSKNREKMTIPHGHNLPHDGVGPQHLIDLVAETSQKSKELPSYQQANAFINLVSSLQKID